MDKSWINILQRNATSASIKSESKYYWNMICHVWLMSPGSLLSSEGRLRGNGSGEEGKCGASVW